MIIIMATIFFAMQFNNGACAADDDDVPKKTKIQKTASLAAMTERFKKSFHNVRTWSPKGSPQSSPQQSRSSAALLSSKNLSRSPSEIPIDSPGTPLIHYPPSPQSLLAHEQKELPEEIEQTLSKMNLWKNPYQRIGKRERTIVMFAARVGQARQVDGLLQYDNSGIDLCDAEGKTALTIAAEEGNAEVVEVLFRHRSRSIYKQDYSGSTPLMYAAGRNNFHVVRQLLTEDTQNECINIVNNKKKSALIGAVERGAVESVRVLLEYRPDITLVDEEGLDALGHACQKYEVVENKEPYEEIIALLKEYKRLHEV